MYLPDIRNQSHRLITFSQRGRSALPLRLSKNICSPTREFLRPHVVANFSPLAGDDVDDNGGADERGYGVEGDDTTLAWQIADKITYQSYYRTAE